MKNIKKIYKLYNITEGENVSWWNFIYTIGITMIVSWNDFLKFEWVYRSTSCYFTLNSFYVSSVFGLNNFFFLFFLLLAIKEVWHYQAFLLWTISFFIVVDNIVISWPYKKFGIAKLLQCALPIIILLRLLPPQAYIVLDILFAFLWFSYSFIKKY